MKALLANKRLMFFGGFWVGLLLIVSVIVGLNIRDNAVSAKNLVITNISSNSFTVSWISDNPYEGSIVFTEGDSWTPIFGQSGKQVAHDQRYLELTDSGEYQLIAGANRKPLYTHYVVVRNLKPETTYTFRVGGLISGKSVENGKVTTLKLAESLQTPDPAYGKVDGVLAGDSFVILQNSTDTAAGLTSSLIADNGSYSFDLDQFKQDSVELKGTDFIAYVYSENKNIAPHSFTRDFLKPLETIKVGN